MNPKDETPQGLPRQPPNGALDVAPSGGGSPGLDSLPAYPMSSGGRMEMPYSSKTNGFAVASFVFGLSGFGVVVSVVCGVRALTQIQARGERGKGFAIAGMVFSGLWVVVAATVGLVGLANESEPGSRSVGSLKVGDCIGDVDESSLVYSATTVHCDQPHDAEVYYQFDLSGSWPGEDAVSMKAYASCAAQLNTLYARSSMLSQISPLLLYPPNERSFRSSSEVSCMAVMTDDSKLTGILPR